MRRYAVLVVILLLGSHLPASLLAQEPTDSAAVTEMITVPPPAYLEVYDTPSDHGGNITLEWGLSPDDGAGRDDVTGYQILRGEGPTGYFEMVGEVLKGVTRFVDNTTADGTQYHYRVAAVAGGGLSERILAGPVTSGQQWFDRTRSNLVVIAILLVIAITYYIYQGAKGKDLHIRKIAGLEAVDEAVGRATEMGRSILFVPGIQDMDNVQTVAGIAILSNIAKRTAMYETKLDVPVSRSITMSVGRETVKQAYLEAGRPDLYNDDIVHYITDEQFGYVAAVDGIMVREKPAACFYLGAFFAESLILAETGSSIGAIQVAGTAMPTQLPFFVAACDYTLIGEELFAASAYLSKDRKMMGSLKGQDAGKAIAMIFIVVGVGIATLAAMTGSDGLTAASEWLRRLFSLNF
ncbi:MAG: fibronectin type III domain-containing protein [Candidatus Eisenbacteria bacterium]